MKRVVRMLAANFAAADIVDQEHALDLEGNVLSLFRERQSAAHVFDVRQRVPCDAFDRRGGHSRLRFRGNVHSGPLRAGIRDDPRGVSRDNRIRRNVVSDDRARADHCFLTDGDAGQERGVRSNGRAAPDCGASQRFRRQVLAASRKTIVSERRVRPDKDIVLQRHAIPELNAALDGDAITDHNIVFDECVIADVAVPADFRAGEHMSESPHPSACPDRCAFYERIRMLKVRLVH